MKGVCSLWTLAALACLDNVTHRRLFTERAPRDSPALMKKLALIYALLLAASPAAAQLATSQRVQQLGGESVQSTPIEAPRTGVFLHRGNDRDVLQRDHRARTRVATGRAACPHRGVGPHQAAYLHRAAALVPSVRRSHPARANRRSTNCATDKAMTAKPLCAAQLSGLKFPLKPRDLYPPPQKLVLASGRNPLANLHVLFQGMMSLSSDGKLGAVCPRSPAAP